MFWIVGGAELVSAIAKKFDIPFFNAISANLTEHVKWEGFHFHDMIFPLFLFIIGVMVPYALGRRLEAGVPKSQLLWKVIRRTALLFFIGWVYYGFLDFKGLDNQRIFGVLQRLALGYGVAATIFLYTNVRGQIYAAAGFLVSYWLLMRFLPVPGFHRGDYSEWGNFANYVDRVLWLPTQNYTKYGDPEGLFSTIPAISTCLLGVLAGHWLRTTRSGMEKVKALVIAGIACIAAGYLWSLDFPVIKKIWTSSYVLVAGGWSLLLLAFFYWIIDVKGWSRWAFFFVVIGLNPLTIYVGDRFIEFESTARFFVRGALKFIPAYQTILFLAAVLLLKWLCLLFLHRKQTYLRV